MKAFFAVLGTTLGVLLLVMLLGVGVGWWGMFFTRLAMPYQEESRRLTYGRSLSYQQGNQTDFENYCLQYQQEKDPQARAMIRNLLIRRKHDYIGPALPDDITDCLAKL